MSSFVRDVVRADAAAWLRLRRQAEPESEHHRKIMKWYFAGESPGRPYVSIALDGTGTAVGLVELSQWYTANTNQPGYYMGIWYVEPHARRQGHGRALVRHASDWARCRGGVAINDYWYRDDEEQLAIHLAVGFTVNERRREFSIYFDEAWKERNSRPWQRLNVDRLRAHDALESLRGVARPLPSQASIDEVLSRTSFVRVRDSMIFRDPPRATLDLRLELPEIMPVLRIDEDAASFEGFIDTAEIGLEFFDDAGHRIALMAIHCGTRVGWDAWLLQARLVDGRAFRNTLRRHGVANELLGI